MAFREFTAAMMVYFIHYHLEHDIIDGIIDFYTNDVPYDMMVKWMIFSYDMNFKLYLSGIETGNASETGNDYMFT